MVAEAAASPGSQGHLPLHRACLCSSITNVKYLIQSHPDALRSADNKGQVSKRHSPVSACLTECVVQGAAHCFGQSYPSNPRGAHKQLPSLSCLLIASLLNALRWLANHYVWGGSLLLHAQSMCYVRANRANTAAGQTHKQIWALSRYMSKFLTIRGANLCFLRLLPSSARSC